MSTTELIVGRFKKETIAKFGFLEARGFRHSPDLDQSRPTFSTVVYLGKHVGFVISLDIRDVCVDAEVVRVRDGRMKGKLDGGYSANIFGHLIEHEGYRGGPDGNLRKDLAASAENDAVSRMIDGWVGLLQKAGTKLLADQEDSLPA